jgi:hypothetical protein
MMRAGPPGRRVWPDAMYTAGTGALGLGLFGLPFGAALGSGMPAEPVLGLAFELPSGPVLGPEFALPSGPGLAIGVKVSEPIVMGK